MEPSVSISASVQTLGIHDRDSWALDLRVFPPPPRAPHHFLLAQLVL